MKDRTIRATRRVLGALLMLAGCWFPPVARAADAPSAGLAQILGELRQGGLVIYLRHAATLPNNAGDHDLTSCDRQRNLSNEGQAYASDLGAALRDLRIPVGTVWSSPYCRCMETARLAFGKLQVNPQLRSSFGATAPEMHEETSLLRSILSTKPPKGTNVVVVSHSSNLREATGLWPKPEGTAFVFRPLENGRFEAVARIAPGQWAKVARLASN